MFLFAILITPLFFILEKGSYGKVIAFWTYAYLTSLALRLQRIQSSLDNVKPITWSWLFLALVYLGTLGQFGLF
jgi:hypothetical protein